MSISLREYKSLTISTFPLTTAIYNGGSKMMDLKISF